MAAEQEVQHLVKLSFIVEKTLKELFGRRVGFALAADLGDGVEWDLQVLSNFSNEAIAGVLKKAARQVDDNNAAGRAKYFKLPVEKKDEENQVQ